MPQDIVGGGPIIMPLDTSNLAQEGTDIQGATMPTGGAGMRGWHGVLSNR